MLEQLNLDLQFNLINATPETASGTIAVANVIAKRLILLFHYLLLLVGFGAPSQRRLANVPCFKAAIAIVIGLTISWLVGYFAPHDRPFVMGINFSEHEATPSFLQPWHDCLYIRFLHFFSG